MPVPSRIYCLLFLAFGLVVPLGSAAQSYTVHWHSTDGQEELLRSLAGSKDRFDESTEAFTHIQQLVPALQERGYLAASIDSLGVTGSVYDAYVFLGRNYRWSIVDFSTLPPGVQVAAAIDTRQWDGQPIRPKQLSRLTERLLRWAEDNGYPFAQAGLDAVHSDSSGGVYGRMVLDRGDFKKIDSIETIGDIRISKQFLMRYLDIHEGDPYNEKKLRNISPRLRELPYLREAEPWEVGFKLTHTQLKLKLAEKKANQLNAIVGLLPNNGETGKFLLTIDALFAFQNILGNGEAISLTYQNLQYKSPRLKVDLVYPYLLNTPVGLDFKFDYFKKDTTWRRTSLQAGGRYQFSAQDYLRVFYQNQGNRLISVDTAYVRQNRRLPETIDVSANGGGTELVLNRTDYRLSPRKGWTVRLGATALKREVKPNNSITGIQDGSGYNYASLYDSLEQDDYQVQLNGELAAYLPLAKRLTLKTGYNGAWISGEHLFRNELYQIGGFRLLRGFDEQSIYANQYHVLTLELRALLNQNSYFYLFSDNAWVESTINAVRSEGFYNGFGAGATLETKSGLFSISYALGRDDNNPVQFRRSRVHFGYVAYF